MKTKRSCQYLLLIIALCSCGGGGGGGSDTQTIPGTSANKQDYGIVMGKVVDKAGLPLGQVAVSADNRTVFSNEQGYFSLDELKQTDRLVINFSKPGYVENTSISSIHQGEWSFVEASLSPIEKTVDFNSAYGVTHQETYTQSGASVQIGPDALVDASNAPFNGMAKITITPFDPSTKEGMACFPGEFKGEPSGGGPTQILESYGFMDVTIKDQNGQHLQIAPNEKAEIVIPVGFALAGGAPSAIPLWYFDHQDGKWHGDGTANLEYSGLTYRGDVTHFTIWNADKGFPPETWSWVQGVVLDGNTGLPIPLAEVRITGLNWSSGQTATATDGGFFISVLPNLPATLVASKGNDKSNPYNFTTSGTGNVENLGNIHINGYPKIQITLTWGENPADLDAHLAIPTGNSWTHLCWATPGHSIEGAKLSTDDTNGKGPEIITIYDLKNGVYRFSVHHYLGGSDISASQAKLNLVINGFGVFQLTPPSGASGVDDLWRAWDITVSNGKVIDVTVINDVLFDISYDDHNAYFP